MANLNDEMLVAKTTLIVARCRSGNHQWMRVEGTENYVDVNDYDYAIRVNVNLEIPASMFDPFTVDLSFPKELIPDESVRADVKELEIPIELSQATKRQITEREIETEVVIEENKEQIKEGLVAKFKRWYNS